MQSKGTLKVYNTVELTMEMAADFIISLARESIDERGRFVISLSGGNTPGKLYILLSLSPFKKQLDWKKIFVFWGDERCVPLEDKRNNAFMAQLELLDKVDIPPANVHRIPVNLPPAEAASAYEKTLKDFFGDGQPCFDLILLGLGTNGHTASLFPATPVLNETEHWVKEVYVAEEKMFRITMTAPFINRARNIAFLVTGEEKAGIMKTVLGDSFQPDKYPAQLIKPSDGNLFWFMDKAAAVELL